MPRSVSSWMYSSADEAFRLSRSLDLFFSFFSFWNQKSTKVLVAGSNCHVYCFTGFLVCIGSLALAYFGMSISHVSSLTTPALTHFACGAKCCLCPPSRAGLDINLQGQTSGRAAPVGAHSTQISTQQRTNQPATDPNTGSSPRFSDRCR